jgi:hypothetical protein
VLDMAILRRLVMSFSSEPLQFSRHLAPTNLQPAQPYSLELPKPARPYSLERASARHLLRY